VVVLSWVSFLTDLSSEMIYPVLPFFLTVTLGAPAAALGLMEGLSELTASVGKGLSGSLSDLARKRKAFVTAGYGISSVAKAALALSPSWLPALGSRLVERVGKGVRTPARDAIIAAETEAGSRGRAFGFHRAMDTWGAVAGATAAFLVLGSARQDFRQVILVSLLPALLAVGLTLAVREKRSPRRSSGAPSLRVLLRPPSSRAYRKLLVAYGLFSLGTSSATFLLLRARSLGLSYRQSILPYLAANVVYALASEPLGRLSDRVGRKGLLLSGMAAFAFGYGLLAGSDSLLPALMGFLLYGLYLACTEGIGKALACDLVDPSDYGRALGFFYLAMGLCTLAASVVAGLLWDHLSPRAPFFQGALLSALGVLATAFLIEEKRA